MIRSVSVASLLVFGLLTDPESSVSKNLDSNRHRSVLVHNEHDTRPNVIYLRPQRDPSVLEPVELLGEIQRGEASSQSHTGHSQEATPEASPTPAMETTPTPEPAMTSTPAATSTPAMTATPGAQ